jgi:hypothetical protein
LGKNGKFIFKNGEKMKRKIREYLKKYGKSGGKNISQFNFGSALMERVSDPSIDVEYFYSFHWEF